MHQESSDPPPWLFGADLKLGRVLVISERPNQIGPLEGPHFEILAKPHGIAITNGDQRPCDNQGVFGERALEYDTKMYEVRTEIFLFSLVLHNCRLIITQPMKLK